MVNIASINAEFYVDELHASWKIYDLFFIIGFYFILF
jgi:hypothetical protein